MVLPLGVDLMLAGVFGEEAIIVHTKHLLELLWGQIQVLIRSVYTLGELFLQLLVWELVALGVQIALWNVPWTGGVGLARGARSLALLDLLSKGLEGVGGEVLFVPVKEAKSEHWWLLTLLNLGDLNGVVVSAIGQGINVLIDTLDGTFALELVSLSAIPDEDLVEVVNNINVAWEQGLLRKTWKLLHVHVARLVGNLEKKWLESHVLQHEIFHLQVVVLSAKFLPELWSLLTLIEVVLVWTLVVGGHIDGELLLNFTRLASLPKVAIIAKDSNINVMWVQAS